MSEERDTPQDPVLPPEQEAGQSESETCLPPDNAKAAREEENGEDTVLHLSDSAHDIADGEQGDEEADPAHGDLNGEPPADEALGGVEQGTADEHSVPTALEQADEAFAEEQRIAAKMTPPNAGGNEMTFTEHLEELRKRLTRCLVAAFVGLLVCYGFAEQLFLQLMAPLIEQLAPSGGTLIYTGLPEAFFTHLKVAAIAGLFLVSPYIFYQLWMFIAPGLYEGERKWIVPIALCSALCFVAGALFGYFIVFPFGFQFFLGYATDFIKPMPSVKEYFGFATSMLFAFGFIFELPLFMLFLSALGVVTHKTLRKHRKYAILANFIVAAILTPPDVVSQLLMAGPLLLLYEIGIWVSYVFGKRPKEPESDAQSATPA
ncbi:MAG: twin-arginine translocase subunit TatC [Desulfovibrionales bacterium]|nr:twin-arginine translocase subunit TatC [Desulfovibrionales bacterium]